MIVVGIIWDTRTAWKLTVLGITVLPTTYYLLPTLVGTYV